MDGETTYQLATVIAQIGTLAAGITAIRKLSNDIKDLILTYSTETTVRMQSLEKGQAQLGAELSAYRELARIESEQQRLEHDAIDTNARTARMAIEDLKAIVTLGQSEQRILKAVRDESETTRARTEHIIDKKGRL